MTTKEEVEAALKTCIDPEIRIDIHTLGLIYRIEVEQEAVSILMTLTSIACPYGPALLDEIRGKVIQLPGVKTVDVTVTFDPPWKPSGEVLASLGL